VTNAIIAVCKFLPDESDSPGMEGQDNIFPPIVKVNPEYWNKILPKSAIQFIVLSVSKDKNICKANTKAA